ncbi:MAG: hypothetical protein HC915_10885 [Anaerolineae bacterium]|nr:hypothetical protein [Anaerolineae bacterium]
MKRQLGWGMGLTCLVLWLAAGVALWRLEAESIWHDEAWSIRAIRAPFETPDDNTPPSTT